MRPYLTLLLWLSASLCLCAQDKLATRPLINGSEQRKALLIGNRYYTTYRPLANTERDVDAMATLLRRLNFAVTVHKNLNYTATVQALAAFRNSLGPNDVALFYYSGHGIGAGGQSYLLPVDADIRCAGDLEIYIPLTLSKIVRDFQTKQVRNSFVFLDACRNLPSLTNCDNSKGNDEPKGLIMPKNNPRGNLIVFATGEGETADDDKYDKTHSLFTSELLKNLATPDIGIREVLDNVINSVEARSGGRQIPQKLEDLRGNFMFAQTAPPTPVAPLTAQENYGKGKKLYDQEGYTAALPYLKAAAEGGNADGQVTLGFMYEKGYGLTRDYAEAVKWYRKAAEQGNADGQNNLGFMYQRGYGLTQDYAEAVEWYRKAAEQGDAYGQNNLGFMYEKGYGVPEDRQKAVELYQKAARQGNNYAQTNLKRLGKTW